MSEQVDLDALIAEARGFSAGSESARATLMRDLADALEQSQAELRTISDIGDGDVHRLAETINENLALKAELRQERERADEASRAAGRHKSDAAYWENEYETAEDMKTELRAALSRAEETIARIDGEVKNFEQSDNDALCEIERHLTEYGKQKEADHD